MPRPREIAVRHVRRDGIDVLKKMEKDHKISEDDHDSAWPSRCRRRPISRSPTSISMLAAKEKEILTV